jgi:hypothetical protein
VTHDRTGIASNLKNHGNHYAQHKCYHSAGTCHCECFGTDWKGHGKTTDKTSTKTCKTTLIAGTFATFNSGTATGCEHRHHYLYEYKGSDCIWTSSQNKLTHPHAFAGAFVRFQVAEYGNMEDADYLLVELKFCGNGKKDCTKFQPTVKMQDDILGWRWTSVYGANVNAYFSAYGKANKDWKAYKTNMEVHHKYVTIRVTLKSSHDYGERHILDNMQVFGAC